MSTTATDSKSLAFARAAYRDIPLYAPLRAPAALDLSDNTNLAGMPPPAEKVLREAGAQLFTRYPSLWAGGLKRALAAYAGVPEECIVTGCGSDDVLDSAVRAFAEPGDTLAYPEPTFPMVPLFAKMNGLLPAPVPLKADGDVDAERLLAAGARITYVCTPNNPTGALASREALEQLLTRSRGVVLVDEAYAEYAGGASLTREAPARGNVLVVRTLSKAFGLAGLRIGYGVGAPALVQEVEKSRGPYKVSALAEAMGTAALTEGLPWVLARVQEVVESRERLVGELRGLGLAPLPSAANFLLFPVPEALAVAARLREAGVGVRAFPALPGIGEALRLSVGPWGYMETALEALRKVLR
jgi:histidinol-phosphate aminotransferase